MSDSILTALLFYVLVVLGTLTVGLAEALLSNDWRGPMETWGGKIAIGLMLIGIPIGCFAGAFWIAWSALS